MILFNFLLFILDFKSISLNLNNKNKNKKKKKIKELGGEIANSFNDCTHLIADKITRTEKFLCGICVCKYILSPSWIEQSFLERRLLG